jgi:hypothetical protein
MSVTGRWPRDRRDVIDLVVVVVVAVLSIVDLAAVRSDDVLAERAADALAYGLVIAGSASLIWRPAGARSSAPIRTRRRTCSPTSSRSGGSR